MLLLFYSPFFLLTFIYRSRQSVCGPVSTCAVQREVFAFMA